MSISKFVSKKAVDEMLTSSEPVRRCGIAGGGSAGGVETRPQRRVAASWHRQRIICAVQIAN